MTDGPIRDEKGRWLPGQSGQPSGVWRAARMSRTAMAAFRRVEVSGWLGGLPVEQRRMVEERALELTRGRLSELPPGLQGIALGVVRDEFLELSIEVEIYGSRKKRLVNKTTGKIAAWVPELVRLRESLDRRRRELDKALDALEPKRAVSLQEYLEARAEPGPDPEEPEIPISPPGGVLDVGNGAGRVEVGNASRTESKPFLGESEKCEWCEKELPARTRRGEARRFCPGSRCRKAAWLAANRDSGIRDGENGNRDGSS